MTRFVVSRIDISDWARCWPGSGLQNPSSEIEFEFASNGDLVDISGDAELLDNADQMAVSALADDVRDRKIGFELVRLSTGGWYLPNER